MKRLLSNVIPSAIAMVLMLQLSIVSLGAQAEPKPKKPGWPIPVHDSTNYSKLLIDRLEYAWGDEEDTVNWEGQYWYGGDTNRLYIEGEGEDVVSGGEGGEIETLDVLYSRMVAPFWDLQMGAGYQSEYGPGPDKERGFAVFGIQGLAPYWFEIDANLRLSDDGDTSADLEAEYDWLLTQRTILQGRFETAYSANDVPEFGIGKGITNAKFGLRLRYEFRREFAPYIGVSWNKYLGDTADLREAESEDTDHSAVVAGIRMWF
ncbi:copper resistance protein B [Thiohalophilus thiocyanatoxydans]|uniref:Copper resistance protein B n=1 Tax=Thiohalophilus thiocyanatoxydans TaxID=381308 RepID=A0A4R8IPN9_9GAMM|nr:copper resistance protein B [Thiohalophilus thiocyanatoxydans]TDY02876.1 copper resistance protein B [Thiohalophilus thiocyanatoxydans]